MDKGGPCIAWGDWARGAHLARQPPQYSQHLSQVAVVRIEVAAAADGRRRLGGAGARRLPLAHV